VKVAVARGGSGRADGTRRRGEPHLDANLAHAEVAEPTPEIVTETHGVALE
jgi:hypothetical protein